MKTSCSESVRKIFVLDQYESWSICSILLEVVDFPTGLTVKVTTTPLLKDHLKPLTGMTVNIHQQLLIYFVCSFTTVINTFLFEDAVGGFNPSEKYN